MNENTLIVRILQITDFHLLGDIHKKFLGINPYNNLIAIMNNATQHLSTNGTNLLLLTGDISQDFSPDSYEHALSITNQLKIPTKIIAGNHDDKNILTQIMLKDKEHAQKSINYDNWSIILLNTHWPNHVAGLLDPQELDFLQQELNNNHDKNIVIFLHHHVLPVGAPWVDKHILINAEQLLDILAQHKNIEAVFSGHVHQESIIKYQHINLYTTPAVAWQFTPKLPTFKLDAQMPGYRIIDLYKDGKYVTKVIRLSHNKAFIPDLNSKGYT